MSERLCTAAIRSYWADREYKYVTCDNQCSVGVAGSWKPFFCDGHNEYHYGPKFEGDE